MNVLVDDDEDEPPLDKDDPLAEVFEQQTKVGAKKLRKLQEKEERKQQRLVGRANKCSSILTYMYKGMAVV